MSFPDLPDEPGPQKSRPPTAEKSTRTSKASEGSASRGVALVSDVHSNLVALRAVLEDIRLHGVEEVLCLGDVVGYGPDPAECLDLVRRECVRTVIGNHETLLLIYDQFGEEEAAEHVGVPIRMAHEQLQSGDLEWICRLPVSVDLEEFEITHASLHKPLEFPYIDIPREARANFSTQKRPVSFHGHTHVPAIWVEDADGQVEGYFLKEDAIRLDPAHRYAINPGSVGQPRDGNPLASYVIFYPEQLVIRHRRVVYSVEQAQSRFLKAGIPDFNRIRIAEGK